MAIVYRATISPTKLELMTNWLDAQPWGGTGPVEMLGSYRFDDPAGEVGVESLLACRGEVTFQLPLTYRDGPLAGADDSLVTTMEHSVLGPRWIYLATGDPIGTSCFLSSLLGTQDQATMEIWADGAQIESKGTGVTLARAEGDGTAVAPETPAAVAVQTEHRLWVPHQLGEDAPQPGRSVLIGSWDSGRSAVAALV